MVTLSAEVWEQIKERVVKLFLGRQQGVYLEDEERAAIAELVESLRALGKPDEWSWNFGDFKTRFFSGRYLAVEFNHDHTASDSVRLKYGILLITLPDDSGKLSYTFSM